MTAILARQPAPAPAAIAGWTVLAIGAVHLALPQRDVRQIDLASDLKESAAGETADAPSLARGPRLDPIGETADAPSLGSGILLRSTSSIPGVVARGPRLDPIGEGWEIGWLIRKSGQSWPAYSFAESLRLERPASAGRKLCVFVGKQGDRVRGILCNRVWSFAADADLVIEAAPGCMTGVRSPATGLAQFEDTVALVTDRATLAAYLDFLLEPAHGEHG